MKFLSICAVILFIGQAFLLDVVPNKTGAQQVQDALSKAEKESDLAAKTKDKDDEPKDGAPKETKPASKNFAKSLEEKDDSKLDNVVSTKMQLLQELGEKTKKFENENKLKVQEGSKLVSSSSSSSSKGEDSLSESIKKADENEKENSELEEASDKKMLNMAKKLNTLVLKFQKKMGHLQLESSKNIDGVKASLSSEDEGASKKVARGKPATHIPAAGIDLGALRRALGLFKSKGLNMKSADDSNVRASYKEDVKLEDRLALEAEEEKKVTNGDTFDDDGASETAAGVDKSNVLTATSAASENSLSPKDQASQEMQNYNALISTESNRELTQIQDEINKATQSSMGKVSVVGQRENVQTESPSLPNLPGLGSLEQFGGAGGTGAGGLEGMFGGAGAGGAGGDPLAAAIAAGERAGEGDSGANGQQATSINDITGGGSMEQMQQQSSPGAGDASLNLGGQSPIEVGSNTPVDMGMFGGANNQQAQFGGAEQRFRQGSEEMQSNLVESQGADHLTGEQSFDPALSFKKSKILQKQKKAKIHSFNKAKNYKRTVGKKQKSKRKSIPKHHH